MLQRVQDFWVRGVLEKSLHNELRIELGTEEQGNIGGYTLEMRLQHSDRPSHTLKTDTKIIDIFDECQSLLILGEPGSGKTTTLLKLTRQVIARAQTDPTQPLPVVFNLASWAKKNCGWESGYYKN
jgi:predicted NACHT family NTPase